MSPISAAARNLEKSKKKKFCPLHIILQPVRSERIFPFSFFRFLPFPFLFAATVARSLNSSFISLVGCCYFYAQWNQKLSRKSLHPVQEKILRSHVPGP